MNDQRCAPRTLKALSLWQPWASLVALGVKTIETRSWSTSYRGWLAIHAAKTPVGFDELPGGCEGKTEGGWVYGYLGGFQAAYCRRTSDEGRRGEAEMVALVDGGPTGLASVPLPLGAVVATCRLIEVIPTSRVRIVPDDEWRGLNTSRAERHWWWDSVQSPESTVSIPASEAEYGDYSDGRFAWLLASIRPVDPPIPARGRQQLWAWQPPEPGEARRGI